MRVRATLIAGTTTVLLAGAALLSFGYRCSRAWICEQCAATRSTGGGYGAAWACSAPRGEIKLGYFGNAIAELRPDHEHIWHVYADTTGFPGLLVRDSHLAPPIWSLQYLEAHLTGVPDLEASAELYDALKASSTDDERRALVDSVMDSV